jgi:DNA end-binding protein Ku
MAKKRSKPSTEIPEEKTPAAKRSLGRPVWGGTISFGLINIPVQLYMGVRRKDIRFHLLHEKDKTRVQQKLFCPAENKEVPRDEVVKGYELGGDQHVIVESEELEALAPKASHTIELSSFIDMNRIDPLYFDKPYYVMPGERGAKAYELLREALESQRKVALGKFVMRNKEYVGVLRPLKNVLCLETLHFADEVILADEIEWDGPQVTVSDAERKVAEQLVESLSADFEPGRLHDDYREALRKLIARKAEGGGVVQSAEPPRADAPQVIDLMAALKKSLADAKRQRGQRVA